jgi:hypothetical protein
MAEERFSLRYGYETKPEHPIFDEAPRRLRYFVLKSLESHCGGVYLAMRLMSDALCRPELITMGITTSYDMWNTLFPLTDKWPGWEIYSVIEPLYANVKSDHRGYAFQNALNQLFGEEGIGWRLKEGKLERTLPLAARQQLDAVFAELGNPRFAPALFHAITAHKAYNAQPRRSLEVCSSIFDCCESVAKEVFTMPTATFGDVLKEARSKGAFAVETIATLEKLYAVSNNHFRHGMTEPFDLRPSEVDWVYLTSLATVLLFVRMK